MVQKINNSNATVTIIVPVYNIGTHLHSFLDALDEQTYEKFKVILIDDGSTDDSVAICDEYASLRSNATVIHQSNAGVSAARNRGLDEVDTPYYTFMDGDDIPYENYLQYLMGLVDRDDADIYVAQSIQTAQESYRHKVVTENVVCRPATVAVLDFLYNRQIHNSPVAKIYSTNAFNEVRFDPLLAIGEDMDYVYRCLMSSSSVMASDIVIYNYMERDGSAMRQNFSVKRMDSYKVAVKFYEDAPREGQWHDAAAAKLFEESFSVASFAKSERKKYEDVYLQCCRSAKEVAWSVCRNPKVRLRQRIYALLTSANIHAAFLVADVKRKVLGGI